jgi:glycine/D-amino acid oxidase-like deaminating enzyme
MGGKIYTHTHARSICGGHSTAEVETSDNLKIIGKHVIVATNVPVNDRVVMFTKLAPYRSYVITCKIPKGSVNSALFWDTADPYH